MTKAYHEILRNTTRAFPGHLSAIERGTGIGQARIYKWQGYDRYQTFEDCLRLVEFLALNGADELLRELCHSAGGSFVPTHKKGTLSKAHALSLLDDVVRESREADSAFIRALKDDVITPDEAVHIRKEGHEVIAKWNEIIELTTSEAGLPSSFPSREKQ